MNTAWQGFWRRRHARKQAEKQPTEEPPRQGDASTDNREERSGGSDSQPGDPGELPRYPKELKALLWTKLGFLGEVRASALEYPSPADEAWKRCAPLKDTYMTMRARERQKLEKKFEAFFSRWDDVTVDITPLVEALRRERRLCESGRTLSDSLWLVELLERKLASTDPEIPKVEADDQAPRESITKRAGDVRKWLVELFTENSVRGLAARLDTIHRLAPACCACIHEATISSGGSTRRREDWEEFFLESDRLAADDATNAGRDADSLTGEAHHQQQERFSLERAFQVDRATTPSRAIKAMLDWPSSKPHSDVRKHLAYFFAAFRRLPAAEQERALPHLREAVFQELVPEDPNLPWSCQKSTTDRWFIRVLSLGARPPQAWQPLALLFGERNDAASRIASAGEQVLALLFGEQNANGVLDLAEQTRDERYEAGKHDAARNECEARQEERLNSIEEQLNYLLGRNDDGFDRNERRQSHLLNFVLNALENDSVYLSYLGSYDLISQYCDLLWDKAVTAILLEQKVTIVTSAYEQWRWLELMRKLSITRLRSQHPEWRLGWRW